LIAGPICPLLKQSASFGDFDVRSLTVTQVQQSSNTWTRYSAYDSMAVEEDLFHPLVLAFDFFANKSISICVRKYTDTCFNFSILTLIYLVFTHQV
jgi:hypothetical protein